MTAEQRIKKNDRETQAKTLATYLNNLPRYIYINKVAGIKNEIIRVEHLDAKKAKRRYENIIQGIVYFPSYLIDFIEKTEGKTIFVNPLRHSHTKFNNRHGKEV